MRQTIVILIALVIAILGSVFGYRYWTGKNEKTAAMDKIELGTHLALSFEVEQECQFGDLDVILADLTLSGKLTTDDLLVTVEPIVSAGSSFQRVTQRLTGAQIAAGLRMELPVQAIKSTEHLGVFLCRDRKRTGRCNDKSIYDYGQLERSLQKGGSPKVRADDKIYFFQYLLAEPGAISFLTENVTSLEQAFKKVDEATSTVSDGKRQAALRKQAKNLFDALGSYVVIKKPERKKIFLEARLSKMNKIACGNDRPAVVPERIRVNRSNVSPVFKNMGFGDR